MSGPGQPATTAQEELLLIHVGLGALAAVLGSAAVLWAKGAAWLVDHQVLVAAAAQPVWVIPGTGGAGLDGARLVALAGLCMGLAVVAFAALAAWWRRSQEVS